MNRRKSREQAFIFVFESTFGFKTIEDILQFAQAARDEKISSFAKNLFEGTITYQEEIDKYIENHIKGWSKERLSKTTLSILRLAVYEMIYYKNTPVSVAINEAVELAKEYSTPEDTAYVNGVLGSISKSITEIPDL